MELNENFVFWGVIGAVLAVALVVVGQQTLSENGTITANAVSPLCLQSCQTEQGLCTVQKDLAAKYAKCIGSITPKDKAKGAILCTCPEKASFSTTKGITPRRIKQVSSIL